MSNAEKPDVATDDSGTVESRLSFADNAEKLLRAILVALGYENAGALRGVDLLTGITAWVTLLITMKREPGGSYASFWARAFLDVCKDCPVEDSAELADNMTNQFARRFPPMLDDDHVIDESSGDRDTQSDLQAAMVELDEQTQLVWQLESELTAIRKLNEHHASELATCRIQLEERTAQRDQLMRDVYGALVPRAKPERVEPGQRWARVDKVIGLVDNNGTECVDFLTTAYAPFVDTLLNNATTWFYLGTDKV